MAANPMVLHDRRPTLTTIFQRIKASMYSDLRGRQFILSQNVDEILTEAIVELAVDELECSDILEGAGLAVEVHRHYRKIFAILIMMRREDDIVVFRRHKIVDANLPLQEATARKVISGDITPFVNNWQWSFLCHYFEARKGPYRYQRITDAQTILPFVKKEGLTEIKGDFGEISAVTIPTGSQTLLHSQASSVILIKKMVKRRKDQSTQDHQAAFNQESRILSLLPQHPNIIPLLAAYTISDEHNLLFPRMEMDLKQFLALKSRFGEFKWDSTFLLALYGLASALETLHDFRLDAAKDGLNLVAVGHHYDFRPANILVNEKTFVLADFGLAGLKPIDEPSESLWCPTPGDYLAPECQDKGFNPQKVTQSIDTWALGCLILDVLTHKQFGPDGVQRFHRQRRAKSPERESWEHTRFYFSREQLKPSVIAWVGMLQQTEQSNEAVQAALLALEPKPNRRTSVRDIRTMLAVPTLRVLVQQILSSLEEYLKAAQHRRRLDMRLWWAHMQICLVGHTLSHEFDDQSHFIKNIDSFGKCSELLMTMLREIDSQLAEVTGSLFSESDSLDIFETRLGSLAQGLVSRLPEVLKKRAELRWFHSFSNHIGPLDLINQYYIPSNQSHNKYRNVARTGMKKALALLRNKDISVAPELHHDYQDLKNVESARGHYYGIFRRQRVLVESLYWKCEDSPVTPEERVRVMELKAKGFWGDADICSSHVLKCLGFVDEVGREDGRDGYSFIYQLPADVDLERFTGMISLSDVLKDTSTKTDLIPDLQERYHLAFSLASFLSELHRTGYLHENFNTRNVVFAKTPISGSHALSDDCSLWSKFYVIGLQKSRPEGQTWHTEGPMDSSKARELEEHPEYRKTRRFVFEYDYYSLGVILLQIANWVPLQKSPGRNIAKDLRERCDLKAVEKLRRITCRTYRDAVLACLDGTLDRQGNGSMEEQDLSALQKFNDNVILPLKKLSALGI